VDLGTMPVFEREFSRIGELLDDLPEDHKSWSDNEYLKAKQKRDAAAGKGFAKRCLLTPDDVSIATAPRTYAKRQSTSPFLTRADGKERLFTPKELCRAHSAPEHLVDGLSDAVAYEGLGQGIDFRQGLAIAMVIARDVCRARPDAASRTVECAYADQHVDAIPGNERQYSLFA
jgi:DNA (cytosine-5)-methyltransferase 1